ncbi:MAG TPA: hypothetical protein VIF62_10250 [Labilithrix sp.]
MMALESSWNDPDEGDELALPLERRVVKRDRTSAARAGAITGALGALAALAATDAVMSLRAANAHPLLPMLGAPLRALLPAPWSAVAGAAIVALIGAVVGAFFARLTRRLEKLIPLLLWTTLFFAALWIVLDAFLLARFPGVTERAPFLPILAGTEAFAIILCLQLPVRRKRVVEVGGEDD